MHQLAPLVYDLALMLGLAGIVVLLFQRIHQPVVLGYLVAGIIVGPYTPPHSLVYDIANIQVLSELGVIFLMFSLGLEFSFQKLTRVGFSAAATGFLEVVLMVFLGYITGILLGWTYYDALFLGAALSISSTTIIIKAIDELGLKSKRFAELIFGVLIVEDLLAILLLVMLSTIVVTHNVFSFDMVSATLKLILVVGAWFLVGYFVMPPLFRRIDGYISQETLTIISVALCLTLVCIAASFHYSTALGAFIMGSIMAETVVVHRVERIIRPIRDIFAAVFFISVGMLIDPRVIVEHWGAVISIALVTVFGKILTTSTSAFLTGQSVNTSVRMGFGMAQVGEFSFIIATLGLSLKVTSHNLYPIIVAVSGITTFTTPYLIRLSGHIGSTLENRLPRRTLLFLQTYTAWIYRTQTASVAKPIYRGMGLRLFTNGLMVALIFSLVHFLVFHQFKLFPENSTGANFSFLFLSLALAAPFIWGMLFAYKSMRQAGYQGTLKPAIFLTWLITFSEVTVLSILDFNSILTTIFFGALAAVLFVVLFKQLERSYRWFESHLVHNLTVQYTEKRNRLGELAPWDTHLVEIEVDEKSMFVSRTLAECAIREKYGVNIVAISHGSRIIAAPRGGEYLFAHDKLIVLGNDQQIDALKHQIEVTKAREPEVNILGKFKLKTLHIDELHPWIGKSIRDSQLREAINGLVVGLERQHIRTLNPDPTTVLQAGDLLLIVGDVKKIKGLRW